MQVEGGLRGCDATLLAQEIVRGLEDIGKKLLMEQHERLAKAKDFLAVQKEPGGAEVDHDLNLEMQMASSGLSVASDYSAAALVHSNLRYHR